MTSSSSQINLNRSLVLLVPHALVVWDVGVRLPAFEFLAGRAVVYFVVWVGVAASSPGQRPLLLLLLLFLLSLLLLAMPVFGVGLNRGVVVIV